MEAGFIGLGTLGTEMAGKLIDAGVALTVWNRTPGKEKGLAVKGTASNPAELIQAMPVVFINVFDSNAVEEVIGGTDGLVDGGIEGKLIIDTTTNRSDRAEAFHRRVTALGGMYVEAPVLTRMSGYTMLLSGTKEACGLARKYIDLISARVFVLPKPGAASRMKLINNSLLGSIMASVSENVVLAEAAGIEKALALEILRSGAASPLVIDSIAEKLVSEDPSTEFSTVLMYKDLNFVSNLAWVLKQPLFMGASARELYVMAEKKFTLKDYSSVYNVLKDL